MNYPITPGNAVGSMVALTLIFLCLAVFVAMVAGMVRSTLSPLMVFCLCIICGFLGITGYSFLASMAQAWGTT